MNTNSTSAPINRRTKGFYRLYFLMILFLSQPAMAQVEGIRDRFLDNNELMVAAHRAAHQKYPENSLKSIEEAIRLGVDLVELDIRVTRDGLPILMHDDSIDRTTNGSGLVEELTYEQINSFYLLYNGEPGSEKVPTLEEAFRVCKGRIMVDMDMKTDQVEAVVEVVKAMGITDHLLFFDSDWKVLQNIKQQLPRAYLMPRAYKTKHIKKAYKKLRPEAIHIDQGFYTLKTIKQANKYGMRIWINSLGDRDRQISSSPEPQKDLQWIQQGANMVQTDFPEYWLSIQSKMNK